MHRMRFTVFPLLACAAIGSSMANKATPEQRRGPPSRYQSQQAQNIQSLSLGRRAENILLHDETQARRVIQGSTYAQLRRDLLSNYDRGSYPWEYAWNNSESGKREGVPIELGMNFHKVYSVDVTNSAADLVVWVRQRWTDPRLRWDPAEYGGLEKTWFWIGDGGGAAGEMSEIWTPDLELWNLEQSLSKSLVDTHAQVTSNGEVFWSRPGHIKPVCKFDGLNEFPFDQLECTMEIGSWGFSGLYLRPVKFGGTGVSVGGSDTAGEAYAEYSLSDVSCDEHLYPPYPGAPEEDWPVMFYHLTFKRAWQPYARGYITLQIILNLAAFCCFWLPPHIGERMSLSITAMLAAVASELVVSSNLPPASEITWVAKFSLVSLVFAALALFESAAVIYFYYHTGGTLTPKWVTWFKRKVSDFKMRLKDERDNNTPLDDSASPEDEFNENEQTTGRQKPPSYNEKPSSLNSTGKPLESLDESGEVSYAYGDDESAGDEVSDDASEDVVIKQLRSRPGPRRRNSLLMKHQGYSFQRRISGSFRKAAKTILGRDADDFKNAQEMENNLRWQKVANNIDNIARVVFPATYVIFLAIAFGRSNTGML